MHLGLQRLAAAIDQPLKLCRKTSGLLKYSLFLPTIYLQGISKNTAVTHPAFRFH